MNEINQTRQIGSRHSAFVAKMKQKAHKNENSIPQWKKIANARRNMYKKAADLDSEQK